MLTSRGLQLHQVPVTLTNALSSFRPLTLYRHIFSFSEPQFEPKLQAPLAVQKNRAYGHCVKDLTDLSMMKMMMKKGTFLNLILSSSVVAVVVVVSVYFITRSVSLHA
ncbi:unnamed protein product [Pleuronectes platessa]|uniref:Uncharacterized protein n=1 Tax=Pleuronectes platessa TaxID=8262 RepID=A0A9N7UYU5_PLEPL|nr:unnamed protein product [Pleuronectes platessa]